MIIIRQKTYSEFPSISSGNGKKYTPIDFKNIKKPSVPNKFPGLSTGKNTITSGNYFKKPEGKSLTTLSNTKKGEGLLKQIKTTSLIRK